MGYVIQIVKYLFYMDFLTFQKSKQLVIWYNVLLLF
jgi:hypothetical protein